MKINNVTALSLMAIGCVVASSLFAGANTWTGKGGNSYWHNAENWSEGVPVIGSGLAVATGGLIDLNGGTGLFQSLTNTAYTTISGGTLQSGLNSESQNVFYNKSGSLTLQDITVSVEAARVRNGENAALTMKGAIGLENVALQFSNYGGQSFNFVDAEATVGKITALSPSSAALTFANSAVTVGSIADLSTAFAVSLTLGAKNVGKPVLAVTSGNVKFTGAVTVDVADVAAGTYVLVKTPAGSVTASNLKVKKGDAELTKGEDYTLSTDGGLSLTLIGEDPPPVDPIPASAENLRLWGFCGIPDRGNDEPETDLTTGVTYQEFIILTNTNPTAEIDLTGVIVNICKSKEKDSASKCVFTIGDASAVVPGAEVPTKIAPGGWVRFNHVDFYLEEETERAWKKITDGDVRITLTAADGTQIQLVEEVDQDKIGVSLTGLFAVADYSDSAELAWTTMPIMEAPGAPEIAPSAPEDFYLDSTKSDVSLYSKTNATVTMHGFSDFSTLTLRSLGGNTVTYTILLEDEIVTDDFDGTVTTNINSIVVDDNYPAIDAVGCNLVIVGEGTLEATSKKKIENGGVLQCNDLSVQGGDTTIAYKNSTVNEPKTACVLLTGNYVQGGGKFKVSAPRGMEIVDVYNPGREDEEVFVAPCSNEFWGVSFASKQTTFTLNEGTFSAKVGGMHSAGIKLKGSCTANINGGKFKGEICGSDARIISGGTINFNNGVVSVDVEETTEKDWYDENRDRTYYYTVTNLIDHARVFKSDYDVTVRGGTFDINVPGEESEAFNSTRDIFLEGGTFEIVAGDDCVSADTNIVVSGVTFYGKSLSGDVIDANCDLTINSGLILAYTQAAGEKGLDVNEGGKLSVNGGTVLALGGTGSSFEGVIEGEQYLIRGSGLDSDLYNGKYVELTGNGKVTTIKLPELVQGFSLMATAPGIAQAQMVKLVDTPPETGSLDFHDVWVNDAGGEPGDPIEEQLKTAKAGAEINLPDGTPLDDVVVDGKKMTIGGRTWTAKPGYVFEKKTGEGVFLQIDPAQKVIGEIKIGAGDEIGFTLAAEELVVGFTYGIESCSSLDFKDSTMDSAVKYEGGEAPTLTAKKHGSTCFYRLSVTDK